jgi:hypothetical protein
MLREIAEMGMARDVLSQAVAESAPDLRLKPGAIPMRIRKRAFVARLRS